MYSVDWFGSHPDEDNDDLHCGEDFDTYDAAEISFHEDAPSYVAYILLSKKHCDGDGKEVHNKVCIRKNPNFKPSCDKDDGWRREQAMEAGMAFGVDAYNDIMGWGTEDFSEE